jgi:RHS repeat-associated protein
MRAIVRGPVGSYSYTGTGYANPDAVTQIANGLSTTTYAYDNNGNLISSGNGTATTTYTYDYANRLIALFAGGATTTYGYDAFGARVLQTGTTTTTFYPFKWYSVASSTVTGAKYSTTTSYMFNGDTLLATVDQQLASGVATGTAKTRYVHPDHLGSTNVVTDENDAVVQTLDYYPYGGTRINTTSGNFSGEKRQYIDQFSDQSGLLYLQARYQDPQRGQFLSQDPAFLAIGNPGQLQQLSQQSQQRFLSDPQQMNSYSYANDNPITKKDPSGLSSRWDPILLGGEIIEQGQYYFNLGKYSQMSPKEKAAEAPKMHFESLTAITGLFAFDTPPGIGIMLGTFALQGLDYGCSFTTCGPIGSVGMTPVHIQQQVLSSMAPRPTVLGQPSNTPGFGTFNNLFSSTIQTRVVAAQNINSSTGLSGSGGGAPNNNSVWVTPSGAVVTFGGQLVAPPPKTK